MSLINGCANFDYREFYCPGVVGLPPEYRANVAELARQLQVVRDTIGRPLKITSGYRTTDHNQIVGGVSRSQHLTASAADVKASGLSGQELYMVFDALIRSGQIRQGGIGVYSTWLHYDIRTDKDGQPRAARWRGG